MTSWAHGTTLLAIGDTGDCDADGTRLVAAAVAAHPQAATATLLELGDLAYPTATREQLLKCHEPHWGRFKRRLAVPGNHDWKDPGAAGFFSIFPQAVPRKMPLGGVWHLLLLDSNLRDEAWQDQLAWLDATLVVSRGECLIAAWHHPRWSSGAHGDNGFTQPLWQRLAGRATFTLHAHDHHFEALPALDGEGRPAPGGLTSFIAGNGGARLYTPGSRARSQRAIYGEWGFLELQLDVLDYRWKAINSQGRVLDSGRGRCLPSGIPPA